jgi:hypothetical protein
VFRNAVLVSIFALIDPGLDERIKPRITLERWIIIMHIDVTSIHPIHRVQQQTF